MPPASRFRCGRSAGDADGRRVGRDELYDEDRDLRQAERVLIASTRRRSLAIGVAVASLALVPPAAAQSTAQFPVQFNFLTPGARSMAMGGAFIGAADDATAAFSNPAGLAFFGTVQLTFEGRGTTNLGIVMTDVAKAKALATHLGSSLDLRPEVSCGKPVAVRTFTL